MSTSTQTIEQSRPAAAPAPAPTEARRRTLSPAVDIVEAPDAYVLTVDLPGVAEQDIDVTVERNLLKLSARRSARSHADHRLVFSEIARGDYRRTFTLPEQVDHKAIAASFRNGVLSLTVPKAAAVLPRKIAIQASA
jgi:HSP20 family molecular chaperone IbpA